MTHLLILGGTTEAAALACALAERAPLARLQVTTSLAGRLSPRKLPPGRIRIGGFGGVDGLTDYLRTAGIAAVVDATHPFATEISRNAATGCEAAGVPRVALVRPPWHPAAGDDWTMVDSLTDAAEMLPGNARRVFLTTGPRHLEPFTSVQGVWFLVRLFERVAAVALPHHELVVARPPFAVSDEIALMRHHRIDTLVTKQSGGPMEAKLAAARTLGAQVVMVRRPPPPPGYVVSSVDAAMAWVTTRLALGNVLTTEGAVADGALGEEL